jgi:hypothetical protein
VSNPISVQQKITLSKETKFHLTFDVDWAPESSIEIVRSILSESNVVATIFATHKSPIIEELISDGHKIGLHPNFLSSTTQGDNPVEVVSKLLDLFPEAQVMRTHSLVQSSPLLYEIFKTFPQLKFDMSLLTHRFSHVGRFVWNYNEVSFDRINFNWEDDAAFFDKNFDWRAAYFPGDLNVYNFHPMHVHLNSSGLSNYEKLKGRLKGPLNLADESLMAEFTGDEPGTRDFLKALLESNATPLSLEELLCELA